MKIDTQKCSGCKACGFICDKKAIEFENLDKGLVIKVNNNLCKYGCSACKDVCCNKAIILENEDNSIVKNIINLFFRTRNVNQCESYEIPYLKCDCCGEILSDVNTEKVCKACKRKLSTEKIFKSIKYLK